MLQETSINAAIIVSLFSQVNVAQNNLLMLRWEFPSSNWMLELFVYIYFFLILLISNVAMVIYQSILRYTVGMLGGFLHLYHYNESHSLDYHS